MDSKNVLNSETKVFGFFSGVEVTFIIGNCMRKDFCIKVLNLKKVDEKQTDEVPSITCIGDSRLVLTSISKPEIREYFSETKTEKTTPKPQKTTSAKDFRSREARRHVMAH